MSSLPPWCTRYPANEQRERASKQKINKFPQFSQKNHTIHLFIRVYSGSFRFVQVGSLYFNKVRSSFFLWWTADRSPVKRHVACERYLYVLISITSTKWFFAKNVGHGCWYCTSAWFWRNEKWRCVLVSSDCSCRKDSKGEGRRGPQHNATSGMPRIYSLPIYFQRCRTWLRVKGGLINILGNVFFPKPRQPESLLSDVTLSNILLIE